MNQIKMSAKFHQNLFIRFCLCMLTFLQAMILTTKPLDLETLKYVHPYYGMGMTWSGASLANHLPLGVSG